MIHRSGHGMHVEKGDVMALSCPIDLDVARLLKEIQSIYTRVAVEPSSDFHFHRGASYAAELLDYDAKELCLRQSTGNSTSPQVDVSPDPLR